MNDFWALLDRLGRLLAWWVIVTPWEEALRVRRGKDVRRLAAGVHFKVPIVDIVYKQSVRLRSVTLPVQTITTKDGKTVTLAATMSYSIRDLRRLYETLHHAEDTVRNLCLAAIASYVQTADSTACSPESIGATAMATLRLDDYGVRCEAVQLTDFAFVRTHRLIMDQKWGGHGDSLNTTESAK